MKSLGVGVASFLDLIRQPIYIILVLCCCALLLGAEWITVFGFGHEKQIIRESGIAGMVLAGLLIVFLTIPGTIGEEIRTRQILTILSKPISRVSLVFGKFLGVLFALFASYCVFALCFALSLYWSEGHVPVQGMLGAIYLGLLQTAIMGAVTLLFSIFLPIPATVSVSFCVFTVGNLLSFLGKQAQEWPSWGKALLDGFLVLFPDMVRLNASYDFGRGHDASVLYLAFATLYVGVYVALVIGIAGLVLSRKEVA